MKVTYDRIRLELDMQRRDQTKDRSGGGAPEFWWGAACQFELGLFYNDTLINDVSNFLTLDVTIKPFENKQGPALMSATVAAADINQVLTTEGWQDGTAQHAVVRFRSSQTRLDMQGQDKRALWLTVTGRSLDGGLTDDLVLGTAKIFILDDGKLTGLVSPPLGSSVIAPGSVYSGAGALAVAVVAGKVYQFDPGPNDVSVTNGTQTITGAGSFTAQGAGVTLNGTPSALVTATLRNPVYYTAEMVEARLANVLQSLNRPGVSIGLLSPDGTKLRRIGVDDNGDSYDHLETL